MMTVEEAKMNREIMQERYGHLLDKYINAGSYPDPKFLNETMDAVNERYGHLLDSVSNPLQKMHDSMIRLQDNAIERRKRKNEEEEYSELVARGRVQVEKINEQKEADRIQSIRNGLMERKKARTEAEEAQKARARQDAQLKHDYLGSIDGLMRINPKLAEDVVDIAEKYRNE